MHRSRTILSSFSHLSKDGMYPKMVDVSKKEKTVRKAIARSTLKLPLNVMQQLQCTNGQLVGPKGPIFDTAIIAGVMGAKQTSNLIPFCHPLFIENCKVDIEIQGDDRIAITCEVKVTHKTGVEMEALTGASIAALCVYDMCKAMSHNIVIEETRLIMKTGGKTNYNGNLNI